MQEVVVEYIEMSLDHKDEVLWSMSVDAGGLVLCNMSLSVFVTFVNKIMVTYID